jgi:uncharacterized protein YndB with AHSA1/START domain
VAHRLLKNTVPSKEYLLVTDAVLERLPAERRERFTPHREEFDVAAITGGYEEIAHLWQAAEAGERKRVLPEEGFVNSDVTVDAPIGLVFDLMLKPDVMQRYLFADAVDAVPGARGEDLGSEFHCHHGGSLVTMRVVSIAPGTELTLTADKPTTMYVTTRLSDAGDGHTRISRSFIWDVPSDAEVAKSIRAMMEGMTLAGESAFRDVFEERAKASRI